MCVPIVSAEWAVVSPGDIGPDVRNVRRLILLFLGLSGDVGRLDLLVIDMRIVIVYGVEETIM